MFRSPDGTKRENLLPQGSLYNSESHPFQFEDPCSRYLQISEASLHFQHGESSIFYSEGDKSNALSKCDEKKWPPFSAEESSLPTRSPANLAFITVFGLK